MQRMSEQTEKNLVSLAKGGSIAGMLAVGLWVLWGSFSRQNEDMKTYFNARIDSLEKRLDDCQTEKETKLHDAIGRIDDYIRSKYVDNRAVK